MVTPGKASKYGQVGYDEMIQKTLWLGGRSPPL